MSIKEILDYRAGPFNDSLGQKLSKAFEELSAALRALRYLAEAYEGKLKREREHEQNKNNVGS